ncbi:MAG TPA: response regulator [Thermoanaerobaculia bacterium]|jgi:signal transduction histidine kinase|nr:response regulator [Thermoanaerobaculia bacterium]
MDDKCLRVLIVEDNPADAELLELQLVNGGYAPSIVRVQTATEMQSALDSEDWDLILSDYTMPRFTGLQALELLKAAGKDIPFILISGSAGDDIAVSAMRAGAHDFFTKGSLALLVSAIQREVREAELRSIARAQREQLHQNEKLAALGTLLAGIAHELNNPLSVIMHQITLLQAELNDDPRQVRAARALHAVNGCSRTIKNFLALARHEPPRREPVSINEVVQAAIDLVAYSLRIDDIGVELELFEPMRSVSGDPQQLERVVLNLMNNAQYALRSRPGPRTLTLRSSIDAIGKRVVLQIADNGGGISPEIRSRIFDPFFTTKPTGEGTGLGLSLCHGIISAHNGTIAVSSEADSGTTFVISLPMGSCVSAGPEVAVRAASPPPALRILVVDDNPDVAMAFSDILSAQGHLVDIAGTSRAALPLIETGAYAVVVTDMRMPDLDGPALYREVTKRCPLLAKSFLFITGDTFSSETNRFLKETGAVYLGKPCTFDEVDSAVEQVLRRCARESAGIRDLGD